MKAKDLLSVFAWLMLFMVPWIAGWYDWQGMVLVALSGIVGGAIGEWLFMPRVMKTHRELTHYLVGETSSGVTLRSADRRVILNRIVCRAAFKASSGKLVRIRLTLREHRFDDASYTYTARYGNEWFSMQITLNFDENSAGVNAIVETVLADTPPLRLQSEEGNVLLEYACLDFEFPLDLGLRELYLKNRTRSRYPGLLPIWLDKQGVSLGKGRRSFHIYHTPEISSMVYRRWPHRLTIFTDHASDHRFAGASASEEHPEYTDLSQTVLSSGDKIISRFTFRAGAIPAIQPLIWLHRNGADATLIWTSHPDNSTLASTKAVVAGSSELSSDDTPIGGFAAHGIPMTQAVFYRSDHPNHIALTNHPDSEEYLQLAEKLAGTYGFEIIPHTAASHEADRAMTQEALQFISERFGNCNWADHSAHIQRASLAGEGTLPGSKNHILDLLYEAGVRYAWHYGSELKYFKGFDLHDDARGLDLLQTGKAGTVREHTPLFWRHPSRLGHLITWKTLTLGRLRHFPMTGLQWLAHFDRHLPRLIINHGVSIIHDYPCWSYKKKYPHGNGIWKKSILEGKECYEVDPDFNRLLAILAKKQQEQAIYCTTVRSFLDYQTAMEQIRFDYSDEDTLLIKNTGENRVELILAFPCGCKLPETTSTQHLRETPTGSLFKLTLDAGLSETLRIP
jgi:hypothetical protein